MKNTLAIGLLALVAACPAETTGPDAPPAVVMPTFSSLYGDYFAACKNCHSPTGPGRTSTTEQTMDWTSRATALSKLKTGMASGLTGNQAACNGVPFLGATPAQSLVLAVLDQPTRQAYDRPQSPDCDVDAISDMTVKVGSQPSAAFIAALKTWIMNGAMDN